ncbi:hypothetical protein AWW66_03195 [Micromonospora rosaria]|uniref:DUF2637 domain-containing protein n=1 Tax=Micromonospora rosaria TaxID=47874 RepID=A0A136PY18_9ACTN|nr:hypothetical protein [Micromonospora rosaria]KXK63332.1 hypothetical protein AWW66_03195 [Micromonospora rosaria]
MKLLSRTPKLSPADLAELRKIELATQIEHARQVDQLNREQAAADREEQRRTARQQEREERRRRKQRAKARARRLRQLRRYAVAARTVGPLLVVNAATIGGQVAYAYDQTPAGWNPAVKALVAAGVAVAAESVALYVGWHAHDALLQGARTTAARLRRASYGIALVMALVNYSHFAGDGGLLDPTALAVILGVLSSLSPWLWGLHTRRMQQVRLLAEDLVDQTGATFDPARRRAFPIRTLMARRWSIDHNVRDPRAAWDGYRADRDARRAAAPAGRIRAAWRVLTGKPAPAQPTPAEPTEPEPAQPAPASLDDPEIRFAALARAQMAAATERLRPGAARVMAADRDPGRLADLMAGGIWAVVDATHEPAHVRRPAPPMAAPPAPATPTQPPAPAPEHQPDQPALFEPTQTSAAGRPGRGGLRRPLDDARLSAEYDRLSAALRREPTGKELAAAAGCSKSGANRWMQLRRAKAAA